MLSWLKGLTHPEVAVPILTGPLRGSKWIISSSVRSCVLGTYEKDKLAQVVTLLPTGGVFYDIGAQAGYHSVLAAKRAGANGAVYSFEPLPRNQSYLRKNLALNDIRNTTMVPAAVSDRDGELAFDPGPGFMAGHLSQSGDGLRVKAVTLDYWQQTESARGPNLIKIDVEGAEVAVLNGAVRVIAEHRPAILIDTHDFLSPQHAGLHEICLAKLRDYGYTNLDSDHSGRFAGSIVALP
ncbi:MAG: FkbM family methyltransferase [Bryobacterales bacterium]|nr:FkbM family methyltransferase [Bryobacterales bacterium]